MILPRLLSPSMESLKTLVTLHPLRTPPKWLSMIQIAGDSRNEFLFLFLLLKLSWRWPTLKSFRIALIFHFSFISSHMECPPSVPKRSQAASPWTGKAYSKRGREQEWRKESQDTPHVFLILPNLAKMCSLVVLLTNKQAIYCTVKCFILTPYSL